MRNILIASALVGITALGTIGNAAAFERHFTVETPRGVLTGTSLIHCSNGTCERQLKIQTANGRTLLRTSSCVKDAPRVWTCTVKGALPKAAANGKSFTITVN